MSQYLGDISAYALAVSQGYTGTEEEYAELMASYATVGQTAVTAAQTATTKASEAATSATTATNKATEATTAAQTATNKAAEAQADADAAALDASQALSAASTATTKATEATTAAATATSAATTATTAKDDAVSAKTAAQTAQTGAETAAASVSASAAQIQTNAEDISQLKSELTAKADVSELLKAFPVDTASGSIASFSDGAELPLKNLTVDIEPIQDLHGYDNPWPAGGGKNKFDKTATNTENGYYAAAYIRITGELAGSANYNISEYIPVSAETVYTLNPTTGSNPSVVFYDSNKQYISGINYSLVTAFTFTTPANAAYLRASIPVANVDIFQLELGSTATAYAPYSNICPISGHTQAVVTRTGKNLLNPDISSWRLRGTAYRYINNVVPKGQTARFTFTDKDTSVSVSGISLGFVYNDLSSSLPSTYTWTLNNGSLTRDVSNVAINGNIGAKCQNVLIYPQSEEAFNAVFARYNVMVELGTTASEYEPYQGETISVSWESEAGTVYGGTLDVTKGELMIDRATAVFDGTENYINTWFPTVVCSSKTLTPAGDYAKRNEMLSNYCQPPKISFATTAATTMQWSRVDEVFGVSSADEFKAMLAQYQADGEPMTIVYHLATPITIQLTPHEVTALLGSNNIWSDAGEVTAEYRADPTLFIQRKIAEAISALS